MKMQFVPWLTEVQLANVELDMMELGMYVLSHMVTLFKSENSKHKFCFNLFQNKIIITN